MQNLFQNVPGGDFLTIGNSITLHGVCDYWWAEDGMAATEIDHDWFHIVVEGQMSKIEDDANKSVNAFAVDFVAWETASKDRAETIVQIEPLLNSDLDLIVVQLGENVSDSLTFEGDFEYLIQRIKTYAPNAQIIIVGNFWPNSPLDDAKKAVASRNDAILLIYRQFKITNHIWLA